jgi:hypothetical protein
MSPVCPSSRVYVCVQDRRMLEEEEEEEEEEEHKPGAHGGTAPPPARRVNVRGPSDEVRDAQRPPRPLWVVCVHARCSS